MRREYSARAVPRGTAGEAGPECHVPTHLRYFLLYLIYLWESKAGRSRKSAYHGLSTVRKALIGDQHSIGIVPQFRSVAFATL